MSAGATRPLDVLVVGAGLSGLVAARRLSSAGASVCVLEARPRVGGRTLSRPLGDGVADLGGLWITPTQTRVRALAEELGLACVPQSRAGAAVLVEPEVSGGILSRLPLVSGLELGLRMRRLERMRSRVDPRNPAAAARASTWDAITLAAWLRGVRTDRARDTLTLLTRLQFAAEPDELSLLHVLAMLAAGSGLTGSASFEGREVRLRGGAQRLCERLAEPLDARVELDCAVARIEQRPAEVVVTCEAGERRARFVILALPPTQARRIEHQPPLPAARAAVEGRMLLGPVIKHAFAYARPFWRERGLSGEGYDARGPVSAVVDHSRGDRASPGSQPALLAFVVGAAARRMSALDREAQRGAVLDALVTMFGPEAAASTAHVSHDWGRDPWSGGCVGVFGPGVLGPHHAALRAPIDRVHIAGTESAVRWSHYMEGAVEAGERAAAEVLARLGRADGA